MTKLNWQVGEDTSSEERERIIEILNEHNSKVSVSYSPRPLTVVVRDEHDRVVGGLLGSTNWDWLRIEILSVDHSCRGQKIGSQLMERAEREAIKRGCHNAFVDTYSFQALPFYEKNGYTIFGELKDYPPGYCRYFLQKRLKDSDIANGA